MQEILDEIPDISGDILKIKDDKMYFNFTKDLQDLSENDLLAIFKHYLINKMKEYEKGPEDVVIGKVIAIENELNKGVAYRCMHL